MKVTPSLYARFLSLFSLLFLVTFIAANPIPFPNSGLDERSDLVPRGCVFSKQAPKYCNYAPPVADLVTTLNNLGVVAGKDSIFYSGLEVTGAQTLAKKWYATNVPSGRGAVSWDDITASVWYTNQAAAIGIGNAAEMDRFQKRLSQAFAAVSTQTVYFFTKTGTVAASISNATAWGGWEYPALTRNNAVNYILQADPTLPAPNPAATIWSRGDLPSLQEPIG